MCQPERKAWPGWLHLGQCVTVAAVPGRPPVCPPADNSRPDGASPGSKQVVYEPQLSIIPYCNTKVRDSVGCYCCAARCCALAPAALVWRWSLAGWLLAAPPGNGECVCSLPPRKAGALCQQCLRAAPSLALVVLCCAAQVIHFVRHGEGFHNIGLITLDSHLTEKGWAQAHALGKHMYSTPPCHQVQVGDVSGWAQEHAGRRGAFLFFLAGRGSTRGGAFVGGHEGRAEQGQIGRQRLPTGACSASHQTRCAALGNTRWVGGWGLDRAPSLRSAPNRLSDRSAHPPCSPVACSLATRPSLAGPAGNTLGL